MITVGQLSEDFQGVVVFAPVTSLHSLGQLPGVCIERRSRKLSMRANSEQYDSKDDCYAHMKSQKFTCCLNGSRPTVVSHVVARPAGDMAQNIWIRITKVDTQSVVAEALPDVCVRQTLTLDRVAKAVTLVRTKISREGACSIVQDAPLTLYLGEPLR